MNKNELSVILQTILEKNGIKKELSEIQKIVNKDMIKIIPKLETASVKNDLRSISDEIAKTLNSTLEINVKVTGDDVFKTLNQELQQISATTTQISRELKTVTDQLSESLNSSKLNDGISNLSNISTLFTNLLTMSKDFKMPKNLD